MKKYYAVLLMVTLILFVFPTCAYASAAEDIDTSAVSDFFDDMTNLYNLIRMIVIFLGAINIAVGAYQILFAARSEATYTKSIQKGKAKILYTLVAYICIILLPYILKWAIAIFNNWSIVKWVP